MQSILHSAILENFHDAILFFSKNKQAEEHDREILRTWILADHINQIPWYNEEYHAYGL